MLYIGGTAYQRLLNSMPDDLNEEAGGGELELMNAQPSLQREVAVASQHHVEPTAGNDLSFAFGTLVRQLRRQRQLTIDALAAESAVEEKELLSIENEPRYEPKPRTVFQLAKYFHLSAKRLLQLAGGAVAFDAGLQREAVRFAARSDALTVLSPQEMESLQEFVRYLKDEK